MEFLCLASSMSKVLLTKDEEGRSLTHFPILTALSDPHGSIHIPQTWKYTFPTFEMTGSYWLFSFKEPLNFKSSGQRDPILWSHGWIPQDILYYFLWRRCKLLPGQKLMPASSNHWKPSRNLTEPLQNQVTPGEQEVNVLNKTEPKSNQNISAVDEGGGGHFCDLSSISWNVQKARGNQCHCGKANPTKSMSNHNNSEIQARGERSTNSTQKALKGTQSKEGGEEETLLKLKRLI